MKINFWKVTGNISTEKTILILLFFWKNVNFHRFILRLNFKQFWSKKSAVFNLRITQSKNNFQWVYNFHSLTSFYPKKKIKKNCSPNVTFSHKRRGLDFFSLFDSKQNSSFWWLQVPNTLELYFIQHPFTGTQPQLKRQKSTCFWQRDLIKTRGRQSPKNERLKNAKQKFPFFLFFLRRVLLVSAHKYSCSRRIFNWRTLRSQPYRSPVGTPVDRPPSPRCK